MISNHHHHYYRTATHKQRNIILGLHLTAITLAVGGQRVFSHQLWLLG